MHGQYVQASHGPPAHKPPPHFLNLPRRLYGLVTQVRTGHAFLGEYYLRHVPDEDPGCPCGFSPQTRAHIIQDCPLYDDHRHILRDVARDLSLRTILCTQRGISALAEFIRRSGAFTKTGDQDLSYIPAPAPPAPA